MLHRFSAQPPVDQESEEPSEQGGYENPGADREPVLGGHEGNNWLDR
jgi:hypothetical protein